MEHIANLVVAQAQVPTDKNDKIWNISEEQVKAVEQFTLDVDREKHLRLRVTKNSMLAIGTEIDVNQIQPYAGFVKIVNSRPIILQPYKNWIVANVMVRNMGRNHRDQFKLGEGQPFGKIYLRKK